MTLLTLVSRACTRLGIDSPTTVIGNTDKQIEQILEIAQEEGEELAARYDWGRLIKEQTFTQVAARDQGALSSIITANDFAKMMNDTIWNRTTTLAITGPVDPIRWQMLQAFPVTGPYQQYKIEGGHLYFDPAGANGTDTIAFAYKSTHWCESSGGTGQALWTADTDVGRLDETLMRLGIMWRWKEVKGLEYAQDFEAYERRVLDVQTGEKTAPRLSLNSGAARRIPGVIVPVGSWSPV